MKSCFNKIHQTHNWIEIWNITQTLYMLHSSMKIFKMIENVELTSGLKCFWFVIFNIFVTLMNYWFKIPHVYRQFSSFILFRTLSDISKCLIYESGVWFESGTLLKIYCVTMNKWCGGKHRINWKIQSKWQPNSSKKQFVSRTWLVVYAIVWTLSTLFQYKLGKVWHMYFDAQFEKYYFITIHMNESKTTNNFKNVFFLVFLNNLKRLCQTQFE